MITENISAQERIQKYFPSQSITIDPMAYQEIRKFDRSLYVEDPAGNHEETNIPIRKIVGTVNKWGGEGVYMGRSIRGK